MCASLHRISAAVSQSDIAQSTAAISRSRKSISTSCSPSSASTCFVTAAPVASSFPPAFIRTWAQSSCDTCCLKTRKLTGLFGFENRKAIFEGVDSRFKFVVLTFEKGGRTESFPAAFMRHDVRELEQFPGEDSRRLLSISSTFIAVVAFSHGIQERTLTCRSLKRCWHFPLLGENVAGRLECQALQARTSYDQRQRPVSHGAGSKQACHYTKAR